MSFGSKALAPPTSSQLARWNSIKIVGCICCRMQERQNIGWPEIHHQTIGGKHGAPRLWHDFTVGLCEWHHRGIGDEDSALGPSLAKTPKAFRREYGSDAELLKFQNKLIGWTETPVRPRNRKSRCTASSKTVPRRGFA